MADTVGWAELMEGNMIGAVYTMFDTAFGGAGWIVVILFFVYQFMLYMKTKNLALMWITGIIFASLYVASIFVEPLAARVIFLMLVLELAAIFYLLIFK